MEYEPPRRDPSKEVNGRRPIDEDKTVRQLIFPGTKWCGQGNIATSYADLGYYQETDMCCREHDYCPDFIPAGKTKYGLKNTAPYTRVHCACDAKFKKCLEKDNTDASHEARLPNSSVQSIYKDSSKEVFGLSTGHD
ncbi:Hypothetical predicted protein [Cloeon dipterum]|uniref:phospholipase A2 n=1 Tax=Cloeon dipterum TaxID=197152 RepID=A0A8S1CBB2_9INSE|nr:Hypothetical predicted protein [Cloeon dipterum]